jgi:hypothetical protein
VFLVPQRALKGAEVLPVNVFEKGATGYLCAVLDEVREPARSEHVAAVPANAVAVVVIASHG